ncbi:uncharacterized protein LOC119594420 [Penaeus monodon]|uniref:uncharacterized protein LOC119594420 n=1 Tax=Penaeus monodon TaxID=6687 RepID=UPI0018A6FD6F|nr:uncharacterized protein LOC119594420 [Penaeus monodon]
MDISASHQLFYERVCLEGYEGKECVIPPRTLRRDVTTRCHQQYSYTQAIARPYESDGDYKQDFIKIRSGCSCQISVTQKKKKRKRKRRRKRKRSEKVEDTEAKENESPKKKKKTNPNVPDEKVELAGELLGIYAKRKTSICERTLIVRMKKFKSEYFKTRPEIFKDAVSYGVKFGKMCFVIYKSKAEAEKKLAQLQKSPEVQIARQWDQREIVATVNPYTLFVEHLPEGTTEEELQETFPTATAMHYDAGKRFVNLAFSTKEDAETVFRKSENLKMKGAGITVLFGKYGYNWERNPGKEQKSN